MPCDTISLASIHLGLCNQDILRQTLEAWADPGTLKQEGKAWIFRKNGYLHTITPNGDLTARRNEETVGANADDLKRAYARKMVQVGAKKFGWDMQIKTPQKLAIRRK